MPLLCTTVRTHCFPGVLALLAGCAGVLHLRTATATIVMTELQRVVTVRTPALPDVLTTLSCHIGHSAYEENDEASKE